VQFEFVFIKAGWQDPLLALMFLQNQTGYILPAAN
jgi:hypothetical protein